MSLGSNIRAARERLNMTQEELAKKLGYKSRSSINKIESGENDIPQSKVLEFAKALDVTVMDLLGPTEADTIPPGFLPLPETESLPLVGRIACGTPILAEENVEGYVDVPKSARATFVLLCQGDSMAPRIQDGDFVYVRKQPTVENGELAAVRIGTEATLKRVYYSPDRPDQLFLQAENPAYPPMIYSGQELEDIAIEGKIVGIYRVVQH